MKKLLSLVICFVMLLQLMPVISFAENEDIYYCREALKDLPNAEALLYAYDAITEGIGAREDIFKIYDGEHKISVEELTVVYDAYRRDHTEHFWMGNQYSYTLNPETNIVIEMQPVYVMSAEELDSAKARFNNEISNIIDSMDSTLSDYEKEKYLHDVLASKVTYVEGDNAHNAYGALVEGEAVCEGYAEALQCLLHAAGIQSIIVLGSSVNPATNTEEGHAWNMVRIDGEYYHTDLTWNDQESAIFYAYFNQDDATIKLDHTIQETVFELPKCTSGKASYFVKNNLVFSSYSVDGISNLLKDNSFYARVYILGDVDEFTNWFYSNITAIAGAAGISPPYTYGVIGIGKELHLIIEICDHSELTKVSAKSPSCTENGNKEYYLCECGKYFEDENAETEISAKDSVIILGGHDFTKATEDNECLKYTPTDCTQHYSYYYRCSRCNEISSSLHYESKRIGPHTLSKTEKAEPSCAETGKKEYYSCTCGKYFEDSLGENEITDLYSYGVIEKTLDHKEVGVNGKCTACGTVVKPINTVTTTAGICILLGLMAIVITIATKKRK